jgi:hypothetical protein
VDDNEANFMEQAQCFVSQEDSNDVEHESSDGDCQKLKKRLRNLENQMNSLRSKLSEQESKKMALDTEKESKGPPLHWRKAKKEANDKFMDAATEALNGVVSSHGARFSPIRVAQLLILVIWTFAGGTCQPFVVKIAKEWLRKHVFTPWAILREMDICGGTLSYEGIEVLRRVETKGEKSFRGGVIPCAADIKRWAQMVEQFAAPLCPFTLEPTGLGEMIQFDIAETF